MLTFIVLTFFVIVLISIGVSCFKHKDRGCGWSCVVFAFSVALFALACIMPSTYDVRDVKYKGEPALVGSYDLTMLALGDGKDAYVLRDYEGYYYFIGNEINKLGYGVDSFKECNVDSRANVVIEKVDNDIEKPYVECFVRDVEMDADNFNRADMNIYVLHVREGDIAFLEGTVNGEK